MENILREQMQAYAFLLNEIPYSEGILLVRKVELRCRAVVYPAVFYAVR